MAVSPKILSILSVVLLGGAALVYVSVSELEAPMPPVGGASGTEDDGKPSSPFQLRGSLSDRTFRVNSTPSLALSFTTTAGPPVPFHVKIQVIPDILGLVGSPYWNGSTTEQQPALSSRSVVGKAPGCGTIFLEWTEAPGYSTMVSFCVVTSDSPLAEAMHVWSGFQRIGHSDSKLSVGVPFEYSLVLQSITGNPSRVHVEIISREGLPIVETQRDTPGQPENRRLSVAFDVDLQRTGPMLTPSVTLKPERPGTYELVYRITVGSHQMDLRQEAIVV